MSNITITVSGPVGSGKSAILGEIEILMKALGVPVSYADEAAEKSEKGMTHADWQSALEMYEPSVVLVEDMPWLRSASEQTISSAVEKWQVRFASAASPQFLSWKDQSQADYEKYKALGYEVRTLGVIVEPHKVKEGL